MKTLTIHADNFEYEITVNFFGEVFSCKRITKSGKVSVPFVSEEIKCLAIKCA